MPGPFPGMDPYLEATRVWEPFHDRLIFHLGSPGHHTAGDLGGMAAVDRRQWLADGKAQIDIQAALHNGSGGEGNFAVRQAGHVIKGCDRLGVRCSIQQGFGGLEP